MKILVTGGAGYIGQVLTPLLLQKGYSVRVADALIFGQSPLENADRAFEFIKGDLRDEAVLKSTLEGIDLIMHLAALVGEPACGKNPSLTNEINVGVVEKLNQLRGDTPLIFLSTSSVYGEEPSYQRCFEDQTEPLPQLPYAKSKYEAEKIIRDAGDSYIILRPATAFGFSPRLRLDLLPNEFTFKAVKFKYLEIYDPHFMRTFIHVTDLSRGIIMMIENFDKLKGQVFNLGDHNLNVTKKTLVDILRSKIDLEVKFVENTTDLDKRNFIVSYDKIAKRGFKTEVSLEAGLSELIEVFKKIEAHPSFYNVNFHLS